MQYTQWYYNNIIHLIQGYEIESLLNENLELDYESTDESDNSSEALSAVTSRSSFKMFVLSMKKKFLKVVHVHVHVYSSVCFHPGDD